MNGASLYSVRQIAEKLSLPESTVRYYRDTYAAYLPVVGTGSRRRYPFETLERIRAIKEGYAKGLNRSSIETRLRQDETPSESSGDGSTALTQYDEVLATILDGERERREAMWQVAREIVRLGEIVERQHVLLGAIADHVGASDRTLPPNGDLSDVDGNDVELIPVGEAATIDGRVEAQLAALREQLESERDLVERLRRSKVDMERRAADAESLLAEQDDTDATTRRRSLLLRLFTRDSDS